MDRATFAQKCRRDVKTVRSKTNDANRERQRQTRQAALSARRPIEETEEELKETEDQPELSEKEEQKAAKMSVFMQRYQEFKKDKEKRVQEEKTSKKEVFKVQAVKHSAKLAPLKANLGVNVSTVSKTVEAPVAIPRPIPTRTIPAPSTAVARGAPPPSKGPRPAAGRSQTAPDSKKAPSSRASSSTDVSKPVHPPGSSRISTTARSTTSCAASRATTIASVARSTQSTAHKTAIAKPSSAKAPSLSLLKPPSRKVADNDNKKSRIPSPVPKPEKNGATSSASSSSKSFHFAGTEIDQAHLSNGISDSSTTGRKEANLIIDATEAADEEGNHIPASIEDPTPTPCTVKVNSMVNSFNPDFLTRYRQHRANNRSRREASRSANLSSVSSSSSSSMMEAKDSESISQSTENTGESRLPKVGEKEEEEEEEAAVGTVDENVRQKPEIVNVLEAGDERINVLVEKVDVTLETGEIIDGLRMEVEVEQVDRKDPRSLDMEMDKKEAEPVVLIQHEGDRDSAENEARGMETIHTRASDSALVTSDSAEPGHLSIESAHLFFGNARTSSECAPCSSEHAPAVTEGPPALSECAPVSIGSLPPSQLTEISESDTLAARDFLDKMESEKQRLLTLCAEAEKDLDCEGIPDAICGRIRTAIGKAQLLTNKKFKQFHGLCQECIQPKPETKRPLASDLLGFWEMVQIQVEDVNTSFSKIDTLRARQWTGPATPEPLFKRMKKPEGKKTIKPESTKPPVKVKSNFRQFLANQAKLKEQEAGTKEVAAVASEEIASVECSIETPVVMTDAAESAVASSLEQCPSESLQAGQLLVEGMAGAGIDVNNSALGETMEAETGGVESRGSILLNRLSSHASLYAADERANKEAEENKEENSPLATPLEGETFCFSAEREVVDEAAVATLKGVDDEGKMEVEGALAIFSGSSSSNDQIAEGSSEVPPEYKERALEFITTMDSEIERITKLSLEAERDLQHETIPDEIVGKIRAAIGKANLLMTKKMKQFRGLCEDCISPPLGEPITKPDDLLGFWEMVQIQVEDVDAAFSRIDTLRQSHWTGPGTPEPLHKRMKSQLKLKDAGGKTSKASKPRGKSKSGLAQFLAEKRKLLVEKGSREEVVKVNEEESEGSQRGNDDDVGEESPLCSEMKGQSGGIASEGSKKVESDGILRPSVFNDGEKTGEDSSRSESKTDNRPSNLDSDAPSAKPGDVRVTEITMQRDEASFKVPVNAEKVSHAGTDVELLNGSSSGSDFGDVVMTGEEVSDVDGEEVSDVDAVVERGDLIADVGAVVTNEEGERFMEKDAMADGQDVVVSNGVGDWVMEGDVIAERGGVEVTNGEEDRVMEEDAIKDGGEARVISGGEDRGLGVTGDMVVKGEGDEISEGGVVAEMDGEGSWVSEGDRFTDGVNGGSNSRSVDVADEVSNDKIVAADGEIEKANGFITRLDNEIERISSMCSKVEKYLESDKVDEENCGAIRACIGKANLLLTKKFKQFRGLCLKCIYPPSGEPRTKPDDLLGFWEMVLIQIEDVDSSFDAIFKLEANDWLKLPEAGENVMENARKGKENVEGRKRPPICIAGARTKAENDPSRPKKPRMNFRSFLAKKKEDQIKRAKQMNSESLPSVLECPGNRASLSPEFGSCLPPPSNLPLPSTPSSRSSPSNPTVASPNSRPPLSPTNVNLTPAKVESLLAFTPDAKTAVGPAASPSTLFAFTPVKTSGVSTDVWRSPSTLPMHPPVVNANSFLFGGDTPELRRLRRSSIFSAQPLRERRQLPLFGGDASEDREDAEGDLISF